MTASCLIYDFETDGADPRTCRVLQAAWRRFDTDLKPLDEGVNVLVRPAPDRLPHPEAIAITGISLDQCMAEGCADAELFRRLHAEMTIPGTCSFGWNTRRFDNEILRFGFWRNFLPAYDHEWKLDCDAWDLIDLARAACALRPEGIVWPTHPDGAPTFRLDALAPANGFDHSDAHDALADVHATAHMATLLKTRDERLWAWARSLSDTERTREVVSDGPFVHVTSRIRATHLCMAPFSKLAQVKGRRNEIIAWNLRQDPRALLDADAQTLRRLLFTRQEDLPLGEERLSTKTIKLNAAPFVAPMRVLRPSDLERHTLDPELIVANHALLQSHGADLAARLVEVHDDPFPPHDDPDDALYDRFAPEADLHRGAKAFDATPDALAALERSFSDPRFGGLLMHWIARNRPDALTAVQREAWCARTRHRLTCPVSGKDLAWDDWCTAMGVALETADPARHGVLLEAAEHGRRVGEAVGLSDCA